MMPNPLSNKDAPFLIGIFLSVVAWGVNGLVSEIGERKLVQYTISTKAQSGHNLFVARIQNLSGRRAIDGATFYIRPAQNKTLLPDSARVSFPTLVDVDVKTGGAKDDAVFALSVLPPGAAIDLVAAYGKDDPRPNLMAFFPFVSAGGSDQGEVDVEMRLLPASTLEACLVRNQIKIYVGLIALAVLLVGVWLVKTWRS